MTLSENPFNITKAVDFTDEEISNYWVDLATGSGFYDLIKPRSSMPMLILGGKGSGKTHLMRYFSYSIQIIRNPQLPQNLRDEGYLGIYLRCGGLNSGRFQGKEQTDDTWNTIFAFYFEIWLSQLFLKIIDDIFEKNPNFKNYESQICGDILSLFDKDLSKNRITTLKEVINTLISYQKEIDYAVNNCALTGKLHDIEITVTNGKLIFGIPNILSKNIPEFKNISFEYLIDEFENLSEFQQKHVNTLLREKELPSSFKIGVKLYGLKTFKTFSGNEENKEGSEYEKILLDRYFREEKDLYEKFIEKLCLKRLQSIGYIPDSKFNENHIDLLYSSFQKFDINSFLQKISNKYIEYEAPYFKKLIKKLQQIGIKNVYDILPNLRCENNPLIERTNIFLFYRDWNNKKDLYKSATLIHKECKKYINDPSSTSRQNSLLKKFKKDIIDQLSIDCGEKIYYSGLESFISMSSGIPRILLIIIKHIFKWSEFNGEAPFKGGEISLESQLKGVKNAADWFYEDARMPGEDGKNIRDSINRLAQFLREIRYSDAPPECSISSFSVNLSELTVDTANAIEYAEQFSYIIKLYERRDKNTKRIDPIYKVNGIIAPKWDLPIYKRGEIHLSNKEAEAIFNPSSFEFFSKVLNNRLSKYNVNYSTQVSLFDE